MSAFDDAMKWVAKDNKRKNRERGKQQRREGSGRQRAHGVVRGTIATVGIAWNVVSNGAALVPGGQPYAEASEKADWAETSLIAERGRQAQDMDEATRAAGYYHGGSGQH